MAADEVKSLASSALLRLFDQNEEDVHELSVAEMAKSFRPTVDEVNLRTALSLLSQAGLVHSRMSRNVSRYHITKSGIDAVNRHYLIDDSPMERNISEKSDKFDIVKYLGTAPEPVNWTRWGTILTGLGILVAIFLWLLSNA